MHGCVVVSAASKRVLLLGWDAADWKIIAPLMERGEMPHLAGLVERGVMGNIATLTPPLSPMLWNSIATGKEGDQHGILSFVEPRPDGKGVQPVSSHSRQCQALWNILSNQRRRCHVVNWYASHPAESIDGIAISNLWAVARGPSFEEWPVPPGAICPAAFASELADLRVHPTDLGPEHILEIVPRAGEVEQANDRRLHQVAVRLAHLYTVHAAGTWLAARDDWDFLAVYYESIDHFSHDFMEFRPPQMSHVSATDVALYGDVVDRVYRHHDAMLGRYLELVGPDTTIFLVSDHGFQSDHLRPPGSSSMESRPLAWHRPYGIFVAAGPGLKRDERVYGCSLLDVAPTILAALDLPAAEDMAGKVLRQIWRESPAVSFVRSYESGSTRAAQTVETADPGASEAVLEQLVALGYLDQIPADAGQAIRQANQSRLGSLAQLHRASGRHRQALEAFVALRTGTEGHGLDLEIARCHLYLGELDNCRGLLDRLAPDDYDPLALAFLGGELKQAEGKWEEAIWHFKSVLTRDPCHRDALYQLGNTCLQLERWKEAEQSFQRMLDLNDESARAWHGAGFSRFKQELPQTAAEALMRSLSLNFVNPLAHYHLGLALARAGELPWAAQAFHIALEQKPDFAAAHMALGRLYEQSGQTFLAQGHRDMAARKLEQKTATPAAGSPLDPKREVVVVSGLPRSGTSLMMQMLAAGGLPIVTDHERAADADNPRGYLEWERIKRLGKDPAAFGQAAGKAVKVISHLLLVLPRDFRYRIIFMERDLDEILASQAAMISRRATSVQPPNPEAVRGQYQRHLAEIKSWLARQPGMAVLFVSYREAVESPAEVARRVTSFLGGACDGPSMAAVADRSLYRQRLSETVQQSSAKN